MKAWAEAWLGQLRAQGETPSSFLHGQASSWMLGLGELSGQGMGPSHGWKQAHAHEPPRGDLERCWGAKQGRANYPRENRTGKKQPPSEARRRRWGTGSALVENVADGAPALEGGRRDSPGFCTL